MVAAGYAIEILFGATGLVPSARNAKVSDAGIGRNYTTWLNIAFLALAAVLLVRFVTSGGLPMLRMMGGPPEQADHPDSHHHDRHTAPDHTRHGGDRALTARQDPAGR
jgi:uncharacterized protein